MATTLPYAPLLLSILFGCGQPQCPSGYMKYGDTCRRCKPGEERLQGRCVPKDASGSESDDDEVPTESDLESSAARNDSTNDSQDSQTTDGTDDGSHSADDPREDTGNGETGSVTDSAVAAHCYLDQDGDGTGAGDPVECNGDTTLSVNNSDCNDRDPKRSPSLTDVCGDRIDNDCDGTPDDESNNACGGPCSTQLGHQPGDACGNGLIGACARTGIYECIGVTSTKCSATSVSPSAEVCGDGIDNDCDGSSDEADAIDAEQWYEDCDGDGFSALTSELIASGIGTRRACVKPTATASCKGGWTNRRPQTGSTWDCDDGSTAYHPGADFGIPPAGRTSVDLDCDGLEEKEDAIAIPGAVVGTFDAVPRCAASLSCTTCGTGPGGGERRAAQWLDAAWRPTDEQPPCSRSTNERYGSFQTIAWEFCPDGQWAGGGQEQSLQRCR